MKKCLLWVSSILLAQTAWGQAPNGYYNSADSLVGDSLRIALREIIRNHTVRSYSDLWDGYRTTDRLPDGKVWDMYSHNPNGPQPYTFTYRTDQCGNYGVEGDCYNREHTWPQSKFGDATPMRTDIVLVVPTDGKVNGQRSNWPYGEVSSLSWTSMNGSKLGTNRYPGSPSSTAFEPIDEYKGDIARIMFYVVTRYYKLDNGWLNWEQGNKAELTPWSLAMFLEWHRADPVSDKERDRNNAIYDFQDNRNPYVDHPEFVDCVFDPSRCNWAQVDTSGVDTSNSLRQMLTANEIKIFPNPATQNLSINWTKVAQPSAVSIDIYDITGRVMTHVASSQATTVQVDVSTWPSGMYIVRWSNEDYVFMDKFVKK